jgi:hypothetical protein
MRSPYLTQCFRLLSRNLGIIFYSFSDRQCDTTTPDEKSQWIYNKVAWQIVPRRNQSQCLQKLFDGYNVGNPIVLKQCHRHVAQVNTKYKVI